MYTLNQSKNRRDLVIEEVDEGLIENNSKNNFDP